MVSKTEKNISILMLPWLAHGHISPFFELAKKLSLFRNFQVFFCSTPINLKPIRENYLINNSECDDHDFSHLIKLIDIELPSSFHELPPHFHTTKNLPPHLMSTLKAAFDEAKPTFCNLLNTLKPDLVIYDFLQPWAPQSADELNIKAVLFLTSGAATTSFLHHCCITSSPKDFPFSELNFPENETQKAFNLMQDQANGITNRERYLECIRRSNDIVLIKTSREIESKYVDYLSGLAGKEMVPVGSLLQESAGKDDELDIMNWLSQKDPGSVVYVSFGSEYFLSKEEMEEIAIGLELSKANFIWVVRFHSGEKIRIHEALPEGFVRRVEERGLVVEGWAPQAKILGHSAIGGFVSHCGWNSTLEGMMFGVPIIAMPMHLDQPFNAKLVAEIGVGMEVPRKNKKLDREELANVIKEVMANNLEEAAAEVITVKRRAKEIGGKLRDRGDEEIDLAIEKLVKLVSGI